jgi:hypothetical protein
MKRTPLNNSLVKSIAMVLPLALGLFTNIAQAVVLEGPGGVDIHSDPIELNEYNYSFVDGGYPNVIQNPKARDVAKLFDLTSPPLVELYKSNASPDSTEERRFRDEYDTTYDPLIDPVDAEISFNGTTYINTDGPLMALAKSGGHTPRWYLWDITGWDGMATLRFVSLWDGAEGEQGSISHVSLFGVTGKASRGVPEPTTTLLLGLGLAGFGIAGFRRRARTAVA